jgi:cystathionine beta-lyase/cystathionine gamma-synthase
MARKKGGELRQFATRAIHAGQEHEAATGAITVPIYQTSTFAQSAPGVHKGYDYSRTDNPTRSALQTALASLESAEYCLAFSSGMGAATTAMLLFKKGDHVVSSRDVYGGTYRLFRAVLENFGLTFSFVETSSVREIERAVTRRTRLVWIESPTNPLLDVVDLSALIAISRRTSAQVLVDNTFATPFGQTPLTLGADLVLHSATKLIGGHSDLLLGAVVCKDAAHADDLVTYRHDHGSIPGALEAFLALRGLRTLAVRLDRAEASAAVIGRRLSSHPHVVRVHYPGLPGDSQHERASRVLLSGSGSMLAFEVAGTPDQTEAFLARLRLVSHATSLGGVESLIERRARYPGDAAIVGPTLCRLSVGIENVEDLWADLDGAMRAVLG